MAREHVDRADLAGLVIRGDVDHSQRLGRAPEALAFIERVVLAMA